MADSVRGSRECLFSFGVISDTHVRAPGGDLSSPFPVNEKANARARYACRLLAAQQPAFVVHLGDMVHPLPAMASYDAACKEALELFQPLMPNLHYVSGNHDVGDKPMPGSPAAIVNDQAMEKYTAWFGKHWYAFDHQQLRIVVINSSLLNSGTAAEKEQHVWLQAMLSNSKDYRVVLFSHYPVFLHDADEAEHYDNIAQPARTVLLEEIARHDVKLVLSGHVHHFFYNRRHGTDFFVLPSTCFTRQDYADMFKASPAAEFGRDDAAKLGVTMVDVFTDGFTLRHLPTDGQELKQQEEIELEPVPVPRPASRGLVVSMRHPWHESIDLPYNGPMEEFTRKRARNDYSLLRLQQLGISSLRVPLNDFREASSRQRLTEYVALGFSYHVICPLNSNHQVNDVIGDLSDSIVSIEHVLPNDSSHWAMPSEAVLGKFAVDIGYASSGAHSANSSKPFAHTVSSGFDISALDNATAWLETQDTSRSIRGLIAQIPWEAELISALEQLQRAFATLPYACVINLRLAPGNPAEQNLDAARIVTRIRNAIEFCDGSSQLSLQLDTFMSIDRGYAPRMGLIDRLGNLTPAGIGLHEF